MKTTFVTIILVILCSCKISNQEHTNLNYIDPTIGNVAPLLNPNRPVVHLPNQMVRVFPIRYDHLDLQITGFPLLALNIITPQVIFSIKPSIGEIKDTCFNRRISWDQDFEITTPWYYSTDLTDDIRVEFTAGAKGGIYRLTYPEGIKKNLAFTPCYENGLFNFEGNNEIFGTEFVEDAIHQQKGIAYLYGVFTGSPEKGVDNNGVKDWGKYSVGHWGGAEPAIMDGEKAWISYPADSPSIIEFRYAISFISREQARLNFKEIENISFDELRNKGIKAWEKVIGQIKVEGGTEAQKRTFYTALYRCYARMVNITEDGKYFSAYDNKVHQDIRPFYVDDYSWGNYPALHPLRIILDPEGEADMLQSYIRMFEQSGWMPDYPKHFGDREGMFGFHSSVMFLDAYRKGIRNLDYKKALEGMLKSAEEATMLPSRNGPKGTLEDFYYKNGYYPGLHPEEAETDSWVLGKQGQKRSSVAITLAHSYDGWALSELGMELGETEIYNKFASTATNYKNLWHAESRFFLPKDRNGNWIETDPKFNDGASGEYYNENNGWMYLWNVQHDLDGLVDLMGGKENFEHRLDQLFTERLERSKKAFWFKFADQTGLIGNFGMGNQVSFFIPYLYNYTHSPWKTQKMTRLILDTWFKDDIFGVPGDEDGGSMSAFVVFSAMGFFPVTPGIPMYSITSPLFSKVSIDLHNGNTFTVIAKNCSRTNKYIVSAKLNGRVLYSPWISHIDLMNGGKLELEMGEIPGKIWEMK
jgi:predicted alpha-1,2-mannosidase